MQHSLEQYSSKLGLWSLGPVLVLAGAMLASGCQNRVAQLDTDGSSAEKIVQGSTVEAEAILHPVRYSTKIHSGSSGALLPMNIDTQLAPLLSRLDEWDQISRVVIVGHTDAEGSEKSNLLLSIRRADALANKLVDFGVPEGVIEVDGRGETAPIASNTSISGKQLNRRVEVIVEGLQTLAESPRQVGMRN